MVLRQHSDRGDEPRATARAGDDAREPRDEPGGDVVFTERRSRGRWEPRCKRRGNFPPSKALKSHKMGKESRPGSVPAPPSRRRLPPSRSSISRTEASRSPGSRRERADGVARKWRRNALKRLNPRREMVWARKPRTYKIWYTGARLTGGGSGVGQRNSQGIAIAGWRLHSSKMGGAPEVTNESTSPEKGA